MSHTNEYDLVIVGAGVVGAALALQLAPVFAERGLRLALVEAGGEPARFQGEQFDPRVVALTLGSRNLFERLGLWRLIAAERVCPYRDMVVWDGEASGRIEFNADDIGCEHLGHIVENSLLVRHLRQALSYQSAVDWLQPVAVTGLALSEAGGRTRLALDNGTELYSSLVVAADGAHSRVRELAGFSVREWAYDQQAIVTTVRTEQSHGYCARQRFMASGPLAFLPLHCRESERGSDRSSDRDSDRNPAQNSASWNQSSELPWDSHYSSIVWSADSALAESLMILDEPAFCARLGRDFEHTLGRVTSVAQRFAIPLYQRHARDYTRPGVVLVGDAAHSIHPLAGQGVNLGLKDAMALAEQVQRALARGLPVSEPSILRRYQRQRLGDNLGMMAAMEGFKRLFGSEAPELIWLRSTGLSQVHALPLLKNTFARKAMGV